jgi:hypothetical protein
MGIVVFFSPWWALGMTLGPWFEPGKRSLPTVGEFFLLLMIPGFVMIFTVGAWHLCIRLAKGAIKENELEARASAQK